MGFFDRSSSASSTDQSVTTNETGISGANNTVIQGGGTLETGRDRFNLTGAQGVTIQQSDPGAFAALADIVRGSSASAERTTLAALDSTRSAAASAGALAQGLPAIDWKGLAIPLGIVTAAIALIIWIAKGGKS